MARRVAFVLLSVPVITHGQACAQPSSTICICMYIYIYIYVHTHTSLSLSISLSLCIHIYIYIYIILYYTMLYYYTRHARPLTQGVEPASLAVGALALALLLLLLLLLALLRHRLSFRRSSSGASPTFTRLLQRARTSSRAGRART